MSGTNPNAPMGATMEATAIAVARRRANQRLIMVTSGTQPPKDAPVCMNATTT